MKERLRRNCINNQRMAEAFEMHRYHEQKVYELLMIWTDDDEKIESMIDREMKKSAYWLERYKNYEQLILHIDTKPRA